MITCFKLFHYRITVYLRNRYNYHSVLQMRNLRLKWNKQCAPWYRSKHLSQDSIAKLFIMFSLHTLKNFMDYYSWGRFLKWVLDKKWLLGFKWILVTRKEAQDHRIKLRQVMNQCAASNTWITVQSLKGLWLRVMVNNTVLYK